MQRQGLLQPFRQTAGGRSIPAPPGPAAGGAGPPGLEISRLPIGSLEPRPPVGLLPFREMPSHILPFMPLAPLHEGRSPKGLSHRRPQTFSAINDDEEALSRLETPITQRLQERREDRLVFGPCFHKPQDVFLTGDGDPNRDHHRHVGEGLPVKKHRHHVQRTQVTVLQRFQLLGTGLRKGSRHR